MRASAMAEKSAAMWEQRLHAAEVAATKRVRIADKSEADMRDRMHHLEQQLKHVKAVAKGAGVAVGGARVQPQQQSRPASAASSKGGDGDGARKVVLLTNQIEIMRTGLCTPVEIPTEKKRRTGVSHGKPQKIKQPSPPFGPPSRHWKASNRLKGPSQIAYWASGRSGSCGWGSSISEGAKTAGYSVEFAFA